LASAQLRKLDWVCQRLRLRPGLRLLDIGCGWGGLARYAARHYGCQVVGITISQEQCRYAQRWCRGLDVEIQLRNYREVNEQFDRVVSVGMVEHVGYKNYRTYMRAAARSLDEDGLFLCQGICGNFSRVHTDPWIERYIFPNSMLPSLAHLTRAAEGDFTCSVARAHFGRAVCRCFRFFFRKKISQRQARRSESVLQRTRTRKKQNSPPHFALRSNRFCLREFAAEEPNALLSLAAVVGEWSRRDASDIDG